MSGGVGSARTRMKTGRITWRDRLLVINGVLFCILGVALLVRYVLHQIVWIGAVMGAGVLFYGGHRLYTVRKELRRRAADPGSR